MTSISPDRDLVLERTLEASAATLYRCWTEPELLKQWFAPKPFTTPEATLDVRPGGSSLIVMQSPEGQKMPNAGVFLEVEPNKKITFTDAFTEAWVPSTKPFMTATVTFEDLGDGTTKYIAVARHWTKEDKEAHEAMGFLAGWGLCADQLEALAQTL